MECRSIIVDVNIRKDGKRISDHKPLFYMYKRTYFEEK